MADSRTDRRLPVGAGARPDGVHFRVWTPRRRHVEVVFENGPASVQLTPEGQGYFSGAAPAARVGSLYRFRLDDDKNTYPDPVLRFQPQGPHGPSEVIDPSAFAWTDRGCAGRR